MTDYEYQGDELRLFAHALQWKQYLASEIAPFLGARVLEVGAGIGATTAVLSGVNAKQWLCLEPDANNARTLRVRIAVGQLPESCSVEQRKITDLKEQPTFDTVLYIDVLEHILDDAGELRAAAHRIVRGGYLVVMSPAHPFLYSPFDAAVGHHRRYTRRSLAAIAPPDVRLARFRYLDSVGLLASAGNRLLLSKSHPTKRQILLWDRWFVRASKRLDPWLGFLVGKSLLAVWKKQ